MEDSVPNEDILLINENNNEDDTASNSHATCGEKDLKSDHENSCIDVMLDSPENKIDAENTDVNENKETDKPQSDLDTTKCDKKGKKQRSRLEIELDVKLEDEIQDFDTFADGSNLFKKYRLRDKVEDKVKQAKRSKAKQNSEEHPYQCGKCRKTFNTSLGLRNHQVKHIKKPMKIKPTTCALCCANFDSNDQLIDHKQTHSNEGRTFLCTECQLAFTDHCDYLLHMTQHMKESELVCIECGDWFKYKPAKYRTHIALHFDRRVPCELCDRKVMNMGKHIQQYHLKSAKRSCAECGKVCSASSYTYHMTTHTGVKKHQCLYCGKGFINAGQKRIHTRTHTGERPFKCTQCAKCFAQSTDLVRHAEKTHQEKKYQCDVCKKMFPLKYYLASHMKLHYSRDYVCKECGENFPSMTSLKTHTLHKHTTEKPYSCETCDVRFKTTNDVRKHNETKVHKRAVYGHSLKADI